jgi:hypothetical protein
MNEVLYLEIHKLTSWQLDLTTRYHRFENIYKEKK